MSGTTDSADVLTPLGQLFNATAVASPESRDVADLVARAKETFPDLSRELDAVLSLWQKRHRLTAATAGAGRGVPRLGRVAGWAVAAAAGVAGTVAYQSGGVVPAVPSLNLTGTPVGAVLLAAVAAGGLIGGLANAYYSDSRGLLPRRVPNIGVWTPGWVGNTLLGLAAAVLTMWLPARLGLPGADGTPVSPPATVWAALVGAAVVGFGGAHAASRRRDSGLFTALLRRESGRDADPKLRALLGRFRSVPELYELVMGKDSLSTRETDEQKLRGMLDPAAWQRYALASSAGWRAAPAGILTKVQTAPVEVRDAVADEALVALAAASDDPQKYGLDRAWQEAFDKVRREAADAAERLSRLPPDWISKPPTP